MQPTPLAAPPVDSGSVGDAERFLDLAHLERALAALPPAPADRGRVVLVVRRVESGRRETPERVRLTPEEGVPGDSWGRRPRPNPKAQVTAMRIDVAELIANGQPVTLFGDNLFLDLDLSTANLPPGSRLKAGGATLEVTPQPHPGCRKFRARFGDDALRFVSNRDHADRKLRGIYLRVVEAGEVAPGDPVEVLERGVADRRG